LLASAGGDGGPDGRRVHLWEGRSLRKVSSLPPQNSPIYALAFDPEGVHLAIAGAEEWVTLLDLGRVGSQLASLGLGLGALPRVKGAPAGPEKPAPPRVVQAPPSKTVNPLSLHARALQLYRQRRWQALVPAARKAIEADPEPKELYQFLADAHFNLQQYALAIEAYQAHLKRCKDCAMALGRIGECHLLLKAEDEALEYLERALKARAQHDRVLALLARLHALGTAKHRDPARAVRYAERAAALVPDSGEHQSILGRAYYRAGSLDKAVSTLTRAERTATEAQNAANQLFLAMAYQGLKRGPEAQKAYRRALEARTRLKLTRPQQQEWKEYQGEAEPPPPPPAR
jgi:tetratricopeptide (TPR) repeat protein